MDVLSSGGRGLRRRLARGPTVAGRRSLLSPPSEQLSLSQGQGASFRGWKDVTSLFSRDDEQHLLERCKSPKSKG